MKTVWEAALRMVGGFRRAYQDAHGLWGHVVWILSQLNLQITFSSEQQISYAGFKITLGYNELVFNYENISP